MANKSLNQGEVIPSQGVLGVWRGGERGIFRGTASRKRMEQAKAKRTIRRMSQRDESDALILLLAGFSEL